MKIPTFISVFALMLFASCNTKPSKLPKLNNLLTGTWIHDQDSLATVQIASRRWIFIYEGEETENDTFQISQTNKLPQFLKETEKADFIVLTNKTDTMYFEIMNLDERVLSLLSYPSGRQHLYYRKKK